MAARCLGERTQWLLIGLPGQSPRIAGRLQDFQPTGLSVAVDWENAARASLAGSKCHPTIGCDDGDVFRCATLRNAVRALAGRQRNDFDSGPPIGVPLRVCVEEMSGALSWSPKERATGRNPPTITSVGNYASPSAGTTVTARGSTRRRTDMSGRFVCSMMILSMDPKSYPRDDISEVRPLSDGRPPHSQTIDFKPGALLGSVSGSLVDASSSKPGHTLS